LALPKAEIDLTADFTGKALTMTQMWRYLGHVVVNKWETYLFGKEGKEKNTAKHYKPNGCLAVFSF